MMVTFQSRAAPEVVLLRDQAEYLLGLIGRRLDARGAIVHDELHDAITRLESEISSVEQAERSLDQLPHSGGGNRMPLNELSQRAWPLLQMMREAERLNADIIWGL
ncbi:DUF1840 domain-containing protein [Paraburkholderia heleia]|uniref:DUF1840 domain-containing protein n=1 Tax=Paraburkholderia heleia TaxID=634127 RepID=UPI0005A9D1B0|nr:DUF1840 domain-containing protein [Paraburkholderia heleia]